MPFNDIGLASGLLCGFLFGYVLENAGFGSPCKLTAQFRMSDWSVFKVMFTAIVVAAVGLFVLRSIGLVAPGSMYVPPAFLGAVAIGGALIGAGFAVGGYCPGTSVVGLFSGRLDALLFSIGLVGGTWLFAGSFDAVEKWTTAGESTAGDTLPVALGVPEWVILVAMIAAAVMIFVIGGRIERHFNGPLDASAAMRD
ncbi:YeeE/YedE thiosulfate transporter family protein [Cognatazoarcus halotolerans]|uniref:YeeE/YedE thiosulfate transporter family protein n=1 Tax=Cognatazoarcus halotolerans TaxID=2686016 RepID=UPI0013589E7A|nr:YeeE/YedE thiosulfate transporter family protein [Cognatazoarcus halotolerans]MCB1900171.1 YeeE/YedE family protein [Rhodocyclaceae bacterium]MCP5308637.1 YeeE/YedE family protein [Zoogloeaceae bacterium]